MQNKLANIIALGCFDRDPRKAGLGMGMGISLHMHMELLLVLAQCNTVFNNVFKVDIKRSLIYLNALQLKNKEI